MTPINFNIESSPVIQDLQRELEKARAAHRAATDRAAEAEELAGVYRGRLEETRRLEALEAAESRDVKAVEKTLSKLERQASKLREDAGRQHVQVERLEKKLAGAREQTAAAIKQQVEACSKDLMDALFSILSSAVRVNLELRELQISIQSAGIKGVRPFPQITNALLPQAMQPDGGYQMISVVSAFRGHLLDHGYSEEDVEGLYDGREINIADAIAWGEQIRRSAAA